MAAAINIRTDYKSLDLGRMSRRCRDLDQVRRLLALGWILDGSSRSETADAAGVTLQIVRDWVIRFNADGLYGLILRNAPGKVSILGVAQRRALAQQVEAGPIAAAHRVVRWHLIDLAQWVWDELGLSITKQTLSREMRALGFRKISARLRHRGQKADDIVDFKKASQASWQKSKDPCRVAPRWNYGGRCYEEGHPVNQGSMCRDPQARSCIMTFQSNMILVALKLSIPYG